LRFCLVKGACVTKRIWFALFKAFFFIGRAGAGAEWLIQPQCGIPSNGFTIPERVKQVRRPLCPRWCARQLAILTVKKRIFWQQISA
jgi:hypothetical protein